MLPTTKFHNISRSTKFILVIRHSDSNIIHKSYISLFDFHETNMRDIDFMNNVIVALSNEEMTKINFVDLEKLYNFVVEKFFHLNSFRASKIASKK